MSVTCCVPYCKTKATSGFHNFPANKERRLCWLKAIQVFHFDEETVSNSFRKVCKKHFVSTDYQTYANGLVRLKHDAVPSQHLPNPTWMEHSYVNRNVTKPKITKSTKGRTPTIPKNKSDSKEFAIEFEQGNVNVSLDGEGHRKIHEEEVRMLKTKISNLQAELKAKQKVISDQKRSLRLKCNQLSLLRQKLKTSKINKNTIMHHIRKVFHEDEDHEKVLFFEMQLKNAGKHKNAHRFTADEKIFCLAIYKHSPKTYRNILKKHFVLPSKRTLGRQSAQLMFESGINSKFFDYLKTTVNGMSEIDKNCVLIWDEIALKPHLDYSENRDIIDGFVEMVSVRRPNFATHALVFMVRGINKKYKEPVAYFFTDGLKHFELVEMVKLVGGAVLDTDLKILASVCDQASNNVTAINALIGTSNSEANNGGLLKYKLRDTTIIHCYDVPHLLKGTRNNLQTKNLNHSVSKRWSNSNAEERVNSKKQQLFTATWDDVSYMYDLNLGTMNGTRRLLPKITPEHINPEKLKMKVCTATQVFSQTYGNAMMDCSQKKELRRDFTGTAQILLFFNDVFDSLNGGDAIENQLNCPVTKTSVHFKYWEYALDMLSKMTFIDKTTGLATNRTKNIQNWQSTIRGYYELAEKCLDLGMKKFSPRNTNQDGLENFFGGIKTNCQNSKALIPIHFRSAYVTSIINKLTCSNSLKSNCESDSSTRLLKNFHQIMLKNQTPRNSVVLHEKEDLPNEESFLNMIIFDPEVPELNAIENYEMTQIASSICGDILKQLHCKDCSNNLQISSETSSHDISMGTTSSLSYPSQSFICNFKKLWYGVNELLPDLCAEKKLKKTIIENVSNIILDEMGCKEHCKTIEQIFISNIARSAIFTFCKNINDLLSNKLKFLSANFEDIQIYQVALAFRNKKKNIGKFTDIFDKI